MDAEEAKRFVEIVLSEDLDEVVVDYGRIGTGCVESRYLRLVNPSSNTIAFQLRRDQQSHPLGETFKVCPQYGEIASGGSYKVTVKYRPRFPHFRDIDYFAILFSNTGSVQLRLEGISLAPALLVSRDVLDFGMPVPRVESSRSFMLINDGTVPAAFSFPFSSSQFAVSPTGGQVLPKSQIRVTVSRWTDRARPSRRLLPLLVHNGASRQLQLLAGAPPYESPPALVNLFRESPTSPSCGPVILDVDRLDFGRTSVIDGEVRVMYASNVSSKPVRVEWLADRNYVFSVQPATALVKPEATAMFEALFLPDKPEQVYWGHVEALLVVDTDGDGAADLDRASDGTLSVPALGHTFPVAAETWVPRVQLNPSPLVLAPCAVSGRVSGTFTLRNSDAAKPLVYDLSAADGSLLVRPVAGCVPPAAQHVITVLHTASAAQVALLQLQLSWRLNLQPAHALQLQLRASQEVAAVAWDPTALQLPRACPGLLVTQPALVRNLSRCRLRLQAQPTDAALLTDTADVTLAPNQRRRLLWSCRPLQCGVTEFVIPHQLQLLDACDVPMAEERVQNLRVTVHVTEEALTCQPSLLQLGERALGAPATGEVTLTNQCAASLSLLLRLLPQPLEQVPSGEADILLEGAAAGQRVKVAAGSSVRLTLSLRPELEGEHRYHLVYELLSEEDVGGVTVRPPCALAELRLTAQHPHLRVADLEAVCGDRFEDKLLLWRLLAVDRVNTALATSGLSLPSICVVFPPRPMTAPPLHAVLLLENPCRVSVSWQCEPGLEADGSRAEEPPWLRLTPRQGEMEPGGRQTVSLTVGPFAAAGLACARLRLSVSGGNTLPLTLSAVAVPAGAGWVYTISEPPCPGLLLPEMPPERPAALHSALGRDVPQRLVLQSVPVGCRVPPLQHCPLYNGGLQPVKYHVHTDHLEQLRVENYGVAVLRCLDTEGVVPAGGCARIRIVFHPLEEREYSVLLPVCVSTPCSQQPLLLVGRGSAPAVPCPPLTPRLPPRQLVALPQQQVTLSHRYVHFGTLCIHTEGNRLVFLHNVSGDVLRFAWTRRLAADDCCAIYGAADSAPSGESGKGPIVRPEPAEGVLRAGEVLAVRLTLSAGQVAQVYSHTVHLAFRNLTREEVFRLNHVAWERECQRRQAEFVIDETHPEGVRRAPSPPPPEPSVTYTTVTLSALIQHVDDTPMSADLSWRQRAFVARMSAPSPPPSVDAGAPVSADELNCVRRLLRCLLWQLLRDCELQTTLKRLRKDAVPRFSQLAPQPTSEQRLFCRPRTGEQPRFIERAFQSLLFNLVREAARGEWQLDQGLTSALPVRKSTEVNQSSGAGDAVTDSSATN